MDFRDEFKILSQNIKTEISEDYPEDAGRFIISKLYLIHDKIC